MSNYRRANFQGGYYFFTLVTYDRKPIFKNKNARDILHAAFEHELTKNPFEVTAICLLPEHFHCIWKLPDNDSDFSSRWASIKSTFTRIYMNKDGLESNTTSSEQKRRRRGVWQKRFWEHQIRDEKDLQRHIDYIHYNPVKHGLVGDVEKWQWSTYHKFVKKGLYKHQLKNDKQNELDKVLEFGE